MSEQRSVVELVDPSAGQLVELSVVELADPSVDQSAELLAELSVYLLDE